MKREHKSATKQVKEFSKCELILDKANGLRAHYEDCRIEYRQMIEYARLQGLNAHKINPAWP
jgi:hypothetical protein